MVDEREAQVARAKRLNASIKELTDGSPGAGGERRVVPRVETVSPRDFVQRRMNEIDGKSPSED